MKRIAPQTLILLAAFAGAFGFVLAQAPVMQAEYAPPPLPRGESARIAFDQKEYALAQAWAAIRAEDGEQAAQWAERSLAAGPENAYAWLALAWAKGLGGDDQGGIAALEESYRLAPRSMPLAVSRVTLAQAWWPRLTIERRHAVLEEVRIARGLDAHAFNLAAKDAPRLALLHQLAQAQ